MGEAAGTYRKLRLLDGAGQGRAIARMAREIVEAEGGTEGFVLIGIRTRGVPISKSLDSSSVSTVADSPVLKKTEIPFPVEGRTVVLCDDVIYTGRTVRAAMDAILDFGRPRKILLAVLVDRGRRELPIEAQFVGKRVATSATEIVSVTFRETDGVDDVWLLDREASAARRALRPAARKSPKRRSKK